MKVWNLIIAAVLGALFSVTAAVAAVTNQSPAVQVVVIPLHISGQYTSSTTAVARFNMPFACTLIGASASARASGGTSPTLAVNVKEAGTTVLGSTISVTAGAVAEGAISDADIADEAAITVDFTIGGTSPTWNDITVLLTCTR